MLTDRDLIGYGPDQPKITWPGNAALAVSIVVNFEEGAEFSVEQGDAFNEQASEVASVVAKGSRDYGLEQIFAYGSRAGFWRFLDALDQFQQKTTFFMCGRAVDRLPELAREAVVRGHEPACHGWRWQTHADYATYEEEYADIAKTVETITDATGVRPRGFFCRGSESGNTRRILSSLDFVYTSNGFDDDVPYYHQFKDGSPPLLVVPYALDCNDMKFFHPNGFVTSDQFVQYVKDGIAVLLAEGKRGNPKMINIGLHLRISGRPSRFAAVLDILSYLDALKHQVWVATRLDIAQHFKAHFPINEA